MLHITTVENGNKILLMISDVLPFFYLKVHWYSSLQKITLHVLLMICT